MITILTLSSCSTNKSAAVDERSVQVYKGKTHRVSKGETIFSISWRYGLDLKRLAEANNIKAPYTIYPGQMIRLDMRNAAVGLTPDQKYNAKDGRSKNKTYSAGAAKKDDKAQSPPVWQWPSSGKVVAQFQGEAGQNKGIDINGKLGEPVLAAASGRVVYAGNGLPGYGKLLIIKHDETFLSAYAHNDEISVKEGDFVKVGQKVADMGSSGTDRVKLHFEIRSNGSPVDPLRYLPKRQ